MTNSKPIILLAFANDRPDQKDYLRNLPVELNALKEILEKAEDSELCHLHILPNVTLDNLVHTLQRKNFRDQIAIFHYSGHSESDELFLAKNTGGLQGAKALGLIPILANQKGLKLVFLNSCYSVNQAQSLITAGIPAVVGTVRAVSDDVATQLAISFYQALGEGSAIDQAWRESTSKIKARLGKEVNQAYYRMRKEQSTRGLKSTERRARFPWELYYREGDQDIRQWNLPDAVENPYFGLPAIPKIYHLPDEPYQFLNRYTKADTRIFFGRGNYIRDIYHRIHSPHTAPVLLLYGQSGVGKSSLLEAGLFPRLEEDYDIIHLRRDAQIGVCAQLEKALQMGSLQTGSQSKIPGKQSALQQVVDQLRSVAKQLKGLALETMNKLIHEQEEKLNSQKDLISQEYAPHLQAWLQLEAASHRQGTILVLDQLEEVFTRPHPEFSAELPQLLEIVKSIFTDPAAKPKGKLLLSYRKEYDPEIDKVFRQLAIPKEKIFIDKLDQKGIKEVILGLCATQEHRNKYRLAVEDGLPTLMAKSLLVDMDSPISPVLQIMLTKLWKKEVRNDHRVFSVRAFQALQQQGILLNDFFYEQMERIRAWEAKVNVPIESSGLALDILHFHTTEYATAGSRSLEELSIHYQHHEQILNTLIAKFKELYLLAGEDGTTTTLMHDTLGPIIRAEVRNSDKPGQRALRILSSKMVDFERATGKSLIDESDLALVESGAKGMRRWTIKEKELVHKSRQHRARLEAERRTTRQIKNVGLGIILLLGGTITWLWQLAAWEAKASDLVSQSFQLEETDASLALAKMDAALAIRPENDIALQGRHDIHLRNEFYALSLTTGRTLPIRSAGILPGDKGFFACQGTSLWFWNHEGQLIDSVLLDMALNQALCFPDERRLLLRGIDEYLRVIKLPEKELQVFGKHEAALSALAISTKGDTVISGDLMGQVILWDQGGKQIRKISAHSGEVIDLTFSSLRQEWASAGRDGWVKWYGEGGVVIQSFHNKGQVTAIQFSPDGQALVFGLRNGEIYWWSRRGEIKRVFSKHSKRVNSIHFRGNKPSFLTTSDDQTALLWDSTGQLLKTYRGHSDFVFKAEFSANGDYFLSASADGTLKWWKTESKIAQTLQFPKGGIHTLAVSKDRQLILVGLRARETADPNAALSTADFFSQFEPANGQSAVVFDQQLREKSTLVGHSGNVTAVAIHPDNAYYLTGGDDTKVILWDSTAKIVRELASHKGTIFSVAFSSDDEYLLTGSADHSAILWSITGDSLARLVHPEVVSAVIFATQTKALFTACYDGKVRKWSLEGQLLMEWSAGSGMIESLCLSPNGQYLATGSSGRTAVARIWNLQGDLLAETSLKTEDISGGRAIYTLAFSPDEKLLAIGADGGLVKCIDLKGRPILSFTAIEGTSVYGLDWLAKPNALLVGSGDGRIRILRD